jgi:pyruvate dehydrogenase E2 component (dihydrolipoamide acetyltransferase)
MSAARDFCLPDLGEGLTEAEIVQWLVAVGDRVSVDQPVAEVATEKAAVQVPTPFEGVVVTLHGQPGDIVAVGTPLVTVEAAEAGQRSEPVAEPTSGSGNVLVGYGTKAAGGTSQRRRRVTSGTPPPRAPAGEGAARAASAPAGNAMGTPASPLVRRLAAKLRIDLTQVTGTGPGGLVRRADVEHLRDGTDGAAAASLTPEAATARIPLRGARRITAERLSRSHAEVPMATAWLAVDATRLLELRDLLNARQAQVHVTPLAVLLRLCAAALQRFPLLNASFDAERGETVMSTAVHLGVATQTDRGLVVPVVREAEKRSAVSIAVELSRLVAAARDGSIDAVSLRGSTFTVSNFGAFGVDGGVAIINPPEAAILGVGRISRRAWIADGEVAARPVVELSLAFDHRVCDGGDAGGFLRLLGDFVEHPELVPAEG